MNRSITIRTGLRLRHLDELEDLDIRSQHLPLGFGPQEYRNDQNHKRPRSADHHRQGEAQILIHREVDKHWG